MYVVWVLTMPSDPHPMWSVVWSVLDDEPKVVNYTYIQHNPEKSIPKPAAWYMDSRIWTDYVEKNSL